MHSWVIQSHSGGKSATTLKTWSVNQRRALDLICHEDRLSRSSGCSLMVVRTVYSGFKQSLSIIVSYDSFYKAISFIYLSNCRDLRRHCCLDI